MLDEIRKQTEKAVEEFLENCVKPAIAPFAAELEKEATALKV